MSVGRVGEEIARCRRERSAILKLAGCELAEVPPEVLDLEGIEELDLSANRLTTVPDALAGLRHLRRVDLRGNPLYRLPAMPGLVLDWSAYERCRGRLQRVLIRGLRLDVETGGIPDRMWDVRGIVELYLDGLSDDPEPGARVRGVVLRGGGQGALFQCESVLTTVPPRLRSLDRLEVLDLQYNRLEELPAWLFEGTCLRVLNLAGNAIRKLPDVRTPSPRLQEIDVSYNPITSLPAWLGSLAGLARLDASGTRLESWPPLRSTQPLRRLDISAALFDGHLTTIPPDILDLPHLEHLDVSGQPITTPPEEVVARGLDAIRDYWRQRIQAGTDYLCEAKLILVGEAGAGKTSLARKILDPGRKLDDPPSTEGIAISRWSFPATVTPRAEGVGPMARDFAVNIWDFGGQEIYHATHQFFLTRRSLYVLVADARKEDTDFWYWLSIVDLLGGHSPVLVVKNEKEGRRRDFDEGAMRGSFPALRGVLATDLADNRGLDDVLRAIRRELAGLPHVGDALPMPWREVREALEAEGRDYVSFEAFRGLCASHGFVRREDVLNLSGYLHDLGICLHFQDDAVLKNVVILRPTWGTDAVYRVLDHRAVQDARGRFSDDDLAAIWSDPRYEGMRHELLRLMMRFELAYELPAGGYLAPQLLSTDRPAWDAPRTWDLTLRWRYGFMPKGIVSRLIVALHARIAEGGRLCWRTGLALEWEGCRALVSEDLHARTLTVQVSGADRRALLALIREQVGRIHGTFPGLRCEEEVPCPCSTCHAVVEPERFVVEFLRRAAGAGRPVQCRQSFEEIDPKQLMEAVFGGSPAAQAHRQPPAREVFLSYSWRADVEVVDRLAESLRARGFAVVRDKDEIRYKDSIRAFMTRLGRGAHVVLVLSRAYFESRACMFELSQLASAPAFRERVFPLLLADAAVSDPRFRLDVVKHWEREIRGLDLAMKEVEASNLDGIRQDIDDYREYRKKAAGILDVLGDMRAATTDSAGFAELLDALEAASPPPYSSRLTTRNPIPSLPSSQDQ